MKLLIVTHVIHSKQNYRYFAYGPYVREMNLWTEFANEVIICAPLDLNKSPGKIDVAYEHKNVKFISVPTLQFNSPKTLLQSLLSLPLVFIRLFQTMKYADHIHLRCPGNMGLLGVFSQIFFPRKKKSVKYAGNWDRKSSQPLSYKLQQAIVSSTILSKNITVLVYGDWNEKSKNIKPFFTASYLSSDLLPVHHSNLNGRKIKLMFAGALEPGKRPQAAIDIALNLKSSGYECEVNYYGDGSQLKLLQNLAIENQDHIKVDFKGNVNAQELKSAYIESDFLILMSESEGWPKVIAEAMWWGCIPLVTPVSCVPWMLQNEVCGLTGHDVQSISVKLSKLIPSENAIVEMRNAAMRQARQFTLDKMQFEIGQILNG